jgi:hypothetical protein
MARVVFTKNSLNTNMEAYQLAVVFTSVAIVFSASKSGPTGSDVINGTTPITSNVWYHVAFTIDNSSLKLYLNGVLEGTTPCSFSGFDYVPGKKVILGGANEPTNNAPMSGYIDNVRFYNRVLSPSEINLLYTTDPDCYTGPPSPPICNNTIYTITDGSIYAYKNISTISATNPTVIPIILPDSAQGLAVGPPFGFSAPNPTFWTIGSFKKLWYFDGNNFVNSNHYAGVGVTNLGGSKNFIYCLNQANGPIYKYNGTGNSIFLNSITTYSNGSANDIVGDDMDNFYLFGYQSPQYLALYNSSANITYSWTISGLPGTPISGGFAITENTITAHNIQNFYLGKPNGVMSFTQTPNIIKLVNDMASCPVSFSSYLVASSGGSVSCSNPNINLTVNTTNYNPTYLWAGPGITNILQNTATVNQPGVYSCTITNGITTSTYVTTYTVGYNNSQLTININPQNNLLCTPSTGLTLTANGANTYTWMPNIAISSNTLASVVINPTINTTYTITGTTTGSCSGTSTINILVKPKPLLTVQLDSIICAGQIATLTASGANTFTWNTGSNSPTIMVTPLVNSTYSVNGTDTNGCANQAIVKQSVVSCLGFKENFINDSEFILFPNPTVAEFTITSKTNYQNVRFELYNYLGELINSKILSEINTIINLSDHSKGIYFVKLCYNNKSLSFRIVKE